MAYSINGLCVVISTYYGFMRGTGTILAIGSLVPLNVFLPFPLLL